MTNFGKIWSQGVKAPDFTYPNTVSREAQADLEQALAAGDAHSALSAYLRLAVAKNIVDPDSLASVIRQGEELAARFEQSDISGLYYGLLGSLYAEAYSRNRYAYDRRQLPEEPHSADITEWSGKQYRQKIKDLAMKSVSRPGELSAMPMSGYADIITASEAAKAYYTTLLDFASMHAIILLSNFDEEDNRECGDRIATMALEMARSRGDIAATILWTAQFDSSMPEAIEALRADYSRYSESEYSGLLLEQYCSRMNHEVNLAMPTQMVSISDPEDVMVAVDDLEDEDEQREQAMKQEACQMIEAFLKKHPRAILANNLRFRLQNMTAAKMQINFNTICAAGEGFGVTAECTNCESITLSIYKIPQSKYGKLDTSIYADEGIELSGWGSDAKLPLRFCREIMRSSQPVTTQTIMIAQADAPKPYTKTVKAEMRLDEPGLYFLVAEASPKIKEDKEIDEQSYPSLINCMPATAVLTKYADSFSVIITEAATGKPIANAETYLYIRNRGSRGAVATETHVSTTDKDGIARFGNIFMPDMAYVEYGFSHKGVKYLIRGTGYMPYLYSAGNSGEDEQIRADVNTDRPLYHPGEEVQMLAVLSKSKAVLPGYAAKAIIYNPNYVAVDTIAITTDEFGRAAFAFAVPKEGLTGHYSIQIRAEDGGRISSASFMVSDFKLPDFEVAIEAVAFDEAEAGSITIRGKATYYSGAAMAGGNVGLTVSAIHWYRSWNSESVYSTEAETDSEGRFEVVLSKADLRQRGDGDNFYMVKCQATSPSGTTATASANFTIGKKYAISIDCPYNKVDGAKPFAPKVSVVDSEGQEASLTMQWRVESNGTVAAKGEFNGTADLSGVRPGRYTFVIESADTTLALPAQCQLVIYNTKTKIIPDDEALFICDNELQAGPDGKIAIHVGTSLPTGYAYVMMPQSAGQQSITMHKLPQGYSTIMVNDPRDSRVGYLTIMLVSDNNVNTATLRIRQPEPAKLSIIGESWRDKLLPGSQEQWRIRIESSEGKGVEAALLLDMYSAQIEAIMPHSLGISYPVTEEYPRAFLSYARGERAYIYSMQKVDDAKLITINAPQFAYLDMLVRRATMRMYGMAAKQNSVYSLEDESCEVEYSCNYDMMSAPIAFDANAGDNEENETTPTAGADVGEAEDIDMREAYVPLAIWAPMLTTDSEGRVCYAFTVPNANTRWRLQALAWTKDLQQGKLIRDFVASKPIMVAPNVPRFMRAGDTAQIAASVINNTDTAATATLIIEIFNPTDGQVIGKAEYQLQLQPNGTETKTYVVTAGIDATAIGIRCKASNGQFTDGEQAAIPVLPAQASLVESHPFYLNPGDKSYEMQLPHQADAKISLTFCENPAWTVVSALPSLRTLDTEYSNQAAAVIFSASIAKGLLRDNPEIAQAIRDWSENPSDSALVSMLDKNAELKIALLNATPWVQASQSESERMAALALLLDDEACDSAIVQAVAALGDRQCSDGGFAWGPWNYGAQESSEWCTESVLTNLAWLKRTNMLPDNHELNQIISRAVTYYDALFENPKWQRTDYQYAIWRSAFADIPNTTGGRASINETIRQIQKDWKTMTNPAQKARAALTLAFNGKEAEAKTLMGSVEQFAVPTPQQGIKFPSVSSLTDYADILYAFAMISPDANMIYGLRQQLIVRKQASDWGPWMTTTDVVAAILTTGTKWTVRADGAKVMAGNAQIEPRTPVERYSGSFTADLSGHGGEMLTITASTAGPAYGAVFTQYSQAMHSVKAYSIPDLSIEKRLLVKTADGWEEAPATLRVGDRVKVMLTIHNKRQMDYVEIIDERSAAFEPADQLPGWVWSDGAGFYRENRDSYTALHISYLSPGTYMLEYELNVNTAGTYSSGVATIQSQRAPELTAHSSGETIMIKEK